MDGSEAGDHFTTKQTLLFLQALKEPVFAGDTEVDNEETEINISEIKFRWKQLFSHFENSHCFMFQAYVGTYLFRLNFEFRTFYLHRNENRRKVKSMEFKFDIHK